MEEKQLKEECLLNTLLCIEQSIDCISQELINTNKVLEKIYDNLKNLNENNIPVKGKVSRWLERTGSKG